MISSEIVKPLRKYQSVLSARRMRRPWNRLTKGSGMKGVQFVVDERGEKTAVVIDLREHARLWEDVYDTLVARARRHEPRESLESVKRRLRSQGKRREDA